MKSIISGFLSSIAMYSAIPVKTGGWDKDTNKYAMCFFPLIGVIIALLSYGWFIICKNMGLSTVLFSAVMTVIPVLISGGIHVDGFIDTCDAMGSHREIPEKHKIMHDPHVGAFGLMMCVVYFILTFGLWAQIYVTPSHIFVALAGYTVSRAYSGSSVILFTPAKDSGLARAFHDFTDKKAMNAALGLYIILAAAFLFYFNSFSGIIFIVFSFIWFLRFKEICYRDFNGNTGDLAGYFMQMCELLAVCIACMAGIFL